MSLINHDGDSLDCGHCVSDAFDANIGIWWHCDDDNITQMSYLPKGVNIRKSHKKNKKKEKINVRLKICLICSLYQNNPSEKYSSTFSRIDQHVQNQSYEKSN